MSVRRPVLLVVDDEPSILRLLRDFGNRSGFDVVTCGGGAEAMEYLHAQTANIAIVDLQMPQIGGLDVLRAIRETYELPIIAPPIPKTIRFAEAPAVGRTILGTSRSHKGAEAYRQVAAGLLNGTPH